MLERLKDFAFGPADDEPVSTYNDQFKGLDMAVVRDMENEFIRLNLMDESQRLEVPDEVKSLVKNLDPSESETLPADNG